MNKRKIWLSVLIVILTLSAVVGAAHAASTGKTPAVKGAQPWMAALVESDTTNAHDAFFCGASLIAPDWVLTAAHCLEDITNPRDVDVIIGRYQLSTREGERIPAAQLIIHNGYTNLDDGQDNDIALIRLSRPATKGTPITLISAATQYTDDPGRTARVTGWGTLTEEAETSPDILHGVNMPVVSQTTCKTSYGSDLLPDSLCAGKAEGGADSCYGDSGGPLVSRDYSGNPIQIGIVSWGDECGAAGSYGVYARITSYNTWINNQTGGLNSPAPTPPPAAPNTTLTLDDLDLPYNFDLVDEDTWDDAEALYYEDPYGGYVDIYVYDGEWDYGDDSSKTINGVEIYFDTAYGEREVFFNVDGQSVEIYGSISTWRMEKLVQSMLQ